MILDENDPLADSCIFDPSYAVSTISTQNTQEPNLYPSQESSQQEMVYDRSVSQFPSLNTPTTTDDDTSSYHSLMSMYDRSVYDTEFFQYFNDINTDWDDININWDDVLSAIKDKKLKNILVKIIKNKNKKKLIKVIHQYNLEDLLLKTHQLKKHQRDIRINNNYQPVKKTATEYTLAERFKKYPYIRYSHE